MKDSSDTVRPGLGEVLLADMRPGTEEPVQNDRQPNGCPMDAAVRAALGRTPHSPRHPTRPLLSDRFTVLHHTPLDTRTPSHPRGGSGLDLKTMRRHQTLCIHTTTWRSWHPDDSARGPRRSPWEDQTKGTYFFRNLARSGHKDGLRQLAAQPRTPRDGRGNWWRHIGGGGRDSMPRTCSTPRRCMTIRRPEPQRTVPPTRRHAIEHPWNNSK